MAPVGVPAARAPPCEPATSSRSDSVHPIRHECPGVAAWCLARVEPFRWNEFGVDVAYSDFPPGVVDDAMVFTAEHHKIVDICSAAEQPMNNMMHLTPPRTAIATGVGATTITGRDRFTLRRGHTPFLATHVQWLALAVEDDRGDLRVAQQPAQLGRGGRATELQLGATGLGAHGLEVEDRADVRAFATLGGKVPVVEGVFADRPECLGLALAQGPFPAESAESGGVVARGRGEVGLDRPGEHVE